MKAERAKQEKRIQNLQIEVEQRFAGVPLTGENVLFLIDVSGSMRTQDLKPDRLEAAKAAAKAFVQKQGEDVKIGIVSFASDASIVQPPTTDHALAISARAARRFSVGG